MSRAVLRQSRVVRRTPRRVAPLLAAGLLLVVLIVLPSPTAVADSTGCTGVSDGQTCFHIEGERRFVEKFVQTRDVFAIPPDYPAICNYYAHFTVEKDGKIYWSGDSDYHKGCWYNYKASRTLVVNESFVRNSKAC